MTRHRWTRWGALVCALAFALPAVAAPVPSDADNPLTQVPATAQLVIQLRGFERTQERLNVLVKNALPEHAEVARAKIEEAIKTKLEGREVKGLKKDGPIFVVVTDLTSLSAAAPKQALLVPVTKYETFRDTLLKEDERKGLKTDPAGYEVTVVNGEQHYFVNRKNGYAVVSTDPDLAASFTKKYDSLAGKLERTTAQHFMDADVSVYVDMEAVNKEYGDAIKQGRDFFERALESSPDKSIAEQARQVFAPLFQAVTDSKAVVVSADLRPEGLRLSAAVEVAAASKTDALLKGWKALPLSELGKLPAGQMVYTGMGLTPEVVKKLGLLMAGTIADSDSKEGKALEKAAADLAAAGPRLRLDAANTPLGALQVLKCDDPAKAVAAQLDVFRAIKADGAYGTAVLQADPVIKEGVQKHAGFTFGSVSMKWDLEKTVERRASALPEEQKKAMAEMLKTIVGEGTTIWLGTDGKAVLQVTAQDWPAARALLDRYLKGEGPLGESQPFKDAAKQLPANAGLVMLIDVPLYSEVVAKGFMAAFAAQGGGLTLPPGFGKPAVKGKTTYLGLAVTTGPARVGFDLWLAADSVHEVYKMYVEKLIKPDF